MVENLKLLRTRSKLSQQRLADLVGVTQQSINKYENHGVEPDIYTLKKLAKCLNTSVDFLIGHTKERSIIENIQNITGEEILLIEDYRKLTAEEKESIRLILQNYTREK